jgi:hypothetical protein
MAQRKAIEDAAEALGISKATAKRWWSYARAWLHREIKTRNAALAKARRAFSDLASARSGGKRAKMTVLRSISPRRRRV